ncbi:MAG TPA: acetolactate synthase [Chloroflexi bacterium]|nr:acetolactate synthase [Chloroflexota bacterium]HBY45138.1 acetolactate synthase [Chloroflexota bacterium]HRA31343.1 thiamine pyrophosphate-binding protein [Thermomicrobiales bacterium]
MTISVGSRVRGGVAIMQALEANGVDTVFGIPGVHNLDLYDVLIDHPTITNILARHEQGAGFMADGYYRTTGKPGVALIVTGPGVTNVATAVGEAFADSSNIFIIATNLERKYLDSLEGNLHEITDQMSVMRPFVKWAKRVMNAAEIPAAMNEAFAALGTGRPRPVYLEVPIDVMAEELDLGEIVAAPVAPAVDISAEIEHAATLIASASNVMIFAGGGAVSIEASARVTRLAEALGAPVVMSLMGKGAIPEDHPYAVGSFGYRWTADNPTTEIMRGSDLAIVVGSGLGVRTTGEATMPLPANIIHIDIDPSEHGKRYDTTVSIVADAAATLDQLLAKVDAGSLPKHRWDERTVAQVRDRLQEPADVRTAGYVQYIDALRAGMDRDAILCNDMTMMAYEGVRYFPIYEPRTYTFPRGFGTLGSAMPTAIGAKVACPDKQVVSMTGDGGFQFTMEEIGAAVHHRIPVTMVIFNDATHSAVKVAQRRTYPGRYVAVDLVNPDYVKLAEAYGIEGIRANSPEELTSALERSKSSDMPVIIDVPIDLESY